MVPDVTLYTDNISVYLYSICLFIFEFVITNPFFKALVENPDSMRVVEEKERAERERADSIYAVKIRAIPLDEALNRLSEDSSSIYNYAYFVQTLEVLYVDTAVAAMC